MPHRLRSLSQRILGRARRLIPSRAFRNVQERCRGLRGIEIGGPSAVFQRWNRWPLYPVVGSLDNYNFATQTLWSRQGSATFPAPGTRPGRELIGEASVMKEIKSSTYEFLLASHVLEHIANPLKALHAWMRITRPSGTIVLVVPHRDGTFDHRRPITTIEHILDDFAADMTEDDETHLQEILDLHDLSRDAGAGSRDAFVARAKDNIEHRSLHHHVFDTELVLKVVDQAGLRMLYVDVELPFHICVACSSSPTTNAVKQDKDVVGNAAYWSPLAAWRRRGLFPSDRRTGEP